MQELRLIVMVLVLTANTSMAQTTTFTYQGQLTESGVPAEGTFDFELALYTVDSGGSSIDVNAFDDVTLTGELFLDQYGRLALA